MNIDAIAIGIDPPEDVNVTADDLLNGVERQGQSLSTKRGSASPLAASTNASGTDR